MYLIMELAIVYNSDKHKDFYNSLINYLLQNNIKYSSFDAKYTKERKKSYRVKGAFSARLDPFVGIYENNNPIKGFYSEANECTLDNIINYIKTNNI